MDELPMKSLKRTNKSSPKENPQGGEDRLNALGDDLLLHVLYFLPTIDAIRTCILSKRWKSLWTYIPSLSFNLHGTPYKKIDDFVSFVEKTLIFNQRSKIFKFQLDLQGELCVDPEFVDFCTLFATNAEVEELSIGFENNNYYSLPSHIFDCSSLTKLCLFPCNIVPHGNISWTLLKNLSIIRSTQLSNDLIGKILSGSPALEVLEIRLCSHDLDDFDPLDIISSSLRKLVIEMDWISSNKNILEIFAPDIKELEILGFFAVNFRLVDVSSLVIAYFGFRLISRPNMFIDDIQALNYYRDYQNILRELLRSVRFVKKLALGSWCFQIVTTLLQEKSLYSPLFECKSLTMEARIGEWELLRMARVLQQNFPHLEKLTIKASNCLCTEDFLQAYRDVEGKISRPSSEDLQKNLNSLLFHDLKIVKIVGARVCNEKQILSIAEFLLKNSRVLEKMVFELSDKVCFIIEAEKYSNWMVSSCFETKDVPKIAHKLQSFPRSSPNANIMVSLRHSLI